jgi:uncharacterized membrane protein YfcA
MFTLEMIIIGGLTGVLSGLLGVGGGFIMIPLLIAGGFLMRGAVAVSLLYVAFTAASGALRHLRLGTADPVLGLILLSGATPMVLVGSHYSTVLSHQTLQFVFALLAIGVAAAYPCWGRAAYLTEVSNSRTHGLTSPRRVLIRRRRIGDGEIIFAINIFYGLAIGACFGFVSGLMGIGGGWLLVPLLVMLMQIPFRIAIGTSLLGILVPAIVGAAAHWQFGNLDLKASVPLILSGIVGAQIGAFMLARIPSIWLERLLVLLFLIVSAYMLGQGLGWGYDAIFGTIGFKAP